MTAGLPLGVRLSCHMMKDFRGKTAVVTGAASGIGRAIAGALAGRGANLHLVDINATGLESTARELAKLGVEVATTTCDLARPDQISAAVRSMVAKWDQINILVNNAGIAYYGPTREMTAEQWDRLMAVNLMAPIQLVRELLPALLAADEAHIVNVCSMYGLAPFRKAAAYQTSKFGLVGFTLAIRAEYSRPGFGVTALCPGFVRTPLIASLSERKLPAWASATPEKVAAEAIRAMRRNKGIHPVTGVAHAYWRIYRFAPWLIDWINREGWRRRRAGRKPVAGPAPSADENTRTDRESITPSSS